MIGISDDNRSEELENMDFSDVAEGGKLHPIHPGEILREEFLIPFKITPHALSLGRVDVLL